MTAPAIETVAQLEDALSEPTPAVVEAVRALEGDLILLGVGGKMGPTLARMARRALDLAGLDRTVYGVSRFSSPGLADELNRHGVKTLSCDLLDAEAVGRLPRVPNVIYMAGRKFGSAGAEPLTWAMNTYVPSLVAEHFRDASIVAFSTGNVYPFTSVASGGPTESDPVGPVGEYAQSVLGRERIFEYFSQRYGTRGVILRLNYAVELRYGVLLDVARKVHDRRPIDLRMGHANIIWQRDANAVTLQAFSIAASPPTILNLTGPEIVSIRQIAEAFGQRFGIEPIFEHEAAPTALLNNAARCHALFGRPTVPIDQLIDWTTHWLTIDGPTHEKPTHFEQRDGRF